MRSSLAKIVLTGLSLLFLAPCTAFAAIVPVTDLTDNSTGSLRHAVSVALPGDTIDFGGLIGTITLTSGGIDINKNLTISGSGAGNLLISGNNASYVFRIMNTYSVAISDLTVFNAAVTTAILNEGSLMLTNAVVRDNTGDMGGGIYSCNPPNTLTVINTTFSNNSAINGGGAISVCGTAIISGSTFSGNNAHYGGAIDVGNTGTVTITNSTFSGNSASLFGGAIETSYDGLSIVNSTFSANSAPTGSALDLYLGGPTTPVVDVRNTLFANGIGSSHCNVAISGTNANNLDYGGPTTLNSCNAAVTGDPMLGALASNGGRTQTLALPAGSAAINVGTTGIGIPTTDQRGTPRDAQPDIGAYEYVAGAPPVATATAVPTLSEWGLILLGLLLTGLAAVASSRRRG
jgi:predicted outer membrane repeat protein